MSNRVKMCILCTSHAQEHPVVKVLAYPITLLTYTLYVVTLLPNRPMTRKPYQPITRCPSTLLP